MKTETNKIILGSLILVVAIGVLIGCWMAFVPQPTQDEKTIAVQVVFEDESTTNHTYTTSEEYLRAVLEGD